MITAFIAGFIFALGLILPLGAQNTFVLQKGVHCKHFKSIATVVATCALSDTILIISAALGVTLFILKFHWVEITMLIVGTGFLWWLAYQVWQEGQRPKASQHKKDNPDDPSTPMLVLTALGVSLLNPYAVLDTIVTIGSTAATYPHNERIVFLVACIIVSWLWFTVLALAGKKLLRYRLFAQYQNHLSAAIMMLSGCYLAYITCIQIL